ncbi:enoyl-CoA hydratase/isomerase family protein [Geomicrobium sp. JCM 19055]|uniref:enoyl-CoA hydratase/isomerase family protein n=1 Tax=Geomicrobium sp. JCM 19055 TaxID=1460649 RepID=UPI00045ED5D2|nr:enoyl-CoA hydratase/isomerase family protein [Geomicrobium sp. JCM 19055]GAK00558.1 3-hydroxyacyl-CoA dehydrogenase [Geomicrobium sp. JCM 19055]
MIEKLVLVERNGKVAYLTLNRPDKLNALSNELFNDLDAALDEVENDQNVSVIIIKAKGKAFSVGYDVGKYTNQTTLEDRDKLEEYTLRWLRLWDFPKPIIAQVQVRTCRRNTIVGLLRYCNHR